MTKQSMVKQNALSDYMYEERTWEALLQRKNHAGDEAFQGRGIKNWRPTGHAFENLFTTSKWHKRYTYVS